ncbi:uncharacterized protein VTP21DRAFT_4602 [Calcarisporiella thermophila]|uniref:uncharacterized protein n=1 Tax=Calcarisporiella thermophila TaxID=911321 RepID=UPI003743A36E
MLPLSKTKLENGLLLFFNFLNVFLFLTTAAAAIINCVTGHFAQIVLNIYVCIICFLLVINEVKAPALVQEYFRFLHTRRGHGFLFLFFGCLVVQEHPFNLTIGIFNFISGLFLILLSYTRHCPPINSLTFNWQNWKDFSSEGLDLPRPRVSNQITESMASVHLNSAVALPAPGAPTLSKTANGVGLEFGQSNGTFELEAHEEVDELEGEEREQDAEKKMDLDYCTMDEGYGPERYVTPNLEYPAGVYTTPPTSHDPQTYDPREFAAMLEEQYQYPTQHPPHDLSHQHFEGYHTNSADNIGNHYSSNRGPNW